MEDSLSYIRIFLLGLLVTTIYNLCCCLLKAIGNSVTPLIFLAVSSVLNVGMDLLFVFVFHWGIEGAAFATVIAQAISAVLSVIYVIKKCPILHVKKSDFVFDGGLIIKLLTTGFSMALMLSIVGIGSVILQSGINGLGKDTVAAHTAGRKILEIVMNPMAAIGAATATFAGQNYGAGKMKRIKEGTRDGIIMTSIWSTAMCLVVYLFAPYLIYLVTDKENLEIVETATMYLKISVPFFYSLGVLVVVRNVLQGIGKRVVPIVASIIEMAGKILVIWLLVPRIKYLGICLAEPSIWLIDGILVLVVFLTVRFADSLNVEERRM